MPGKRRVEVFSAGCALCEDAIAMVSRVACNSCEVEVLDMRDPSVAARAKSLGVRTAPAVVIDGRLAACCTGAGPDEAAQDRRYRHAASVNDFHQCPGSQSENWRAAPASIARL